METWLAHANGVATQQMKLRDPSCGIQEHSITFHQKRDFQYRRLRLRAYSERAHPRAKKYQVLIGFVCSSTLLIASCSRGVESPAPVEIEHEISPAPARVGPVTITFKLADANGKLITGARIAIEADMSHAGMSPVFAEAKEEAAGRYEAHLKFQMAGDWVILLHVTLPGGKKLEQQIDVRDVRPN